MFVDKVAVRVRAGNGGDGAVSFRHEKYVDRGGPDGGDGGRGGNVIFVADRNENTLVHFRYKQEIRASHGTAGFHRRQHGRNGEDMIVKVPLGTQLYHNDMLVADLTEHDKQIIVARGGDGGFGNAHFKSSVRQAPKVAEVGEKGEDKELVLELKLLADVGLVGYPNAGKSTFLSVVSNAKPDIGDYPFTTLSPHVGVADIDDSSILIADIPGLIEGAAQGKGLGDAFLRHIERTQVVVHLIDIYEADVAKAYTTITNELVAYSKKLAHLPQIVALTKIEGLPEDGVLQQVKNLKKAVPKGVHVTAVSSHARIGLNDLLRRAKKMVEAARSAQEPVQPQDVVPTITLSANAHMLTWHVTRQNGQFVVTGSKIEKFAARTNFSSEPGVRRLRDIIKRMGIAHELERQGVRPGDTVVIGANGSHHITYEPM